METVQCSAETESGGFHLEGLMLHGCRQSPVLKPTWTEEVINASPSPPHNPKA